GLNVSHIGHRFHETGTPAARAAFSRLILCRSSICSERLLRFSAVQPRLMAMACCSPQECLPLAIMPCELSFGVPKNRCSGLTHLRRSHAWLTCIPGGISPFFHSIITL